MNSENVRGQLFRKIQQARVKLQNKDIKKSGVNSYFKNGNNVHRYYELQDFLPYVNEIFNELKLTDYMQFNDGVGALYIVDNETGEEVKFTSPIDKNYGKTQEIGAMLTYMRRYLYVLALNISESDILDSPNNFNRDRMIEQIKKRTTFENTQEWRSKNNVVATNFDELKDDEVLKMWNIATNGGKNI